MHTESDKQFLFFSIVIPVYNRPAEIDELLESLTKQTLKDFEVIIVEDGSQIKCNEQIDKYKYLLTVKYYYQENTGPGLSRNYGCGKAEGNFFIFLDSDCVLPPHYIQAIRSSFMNDYPDAFGGPDDARQDFSIQQKAINYAMTSFLTTGGVRGNKKVIDHYQPRSFNMGFSKKVYEKTGGFSDIHPGEDPDLSYRIMNEGYRIKFIEDAYVYHKRRIDFPKFIKQVYKFGVVRTILMKWHPDKFKIVYAFPSLFLITSLILLIGSFFLSLWYFVPLLLLIVLLFMDSLIKTKNLSISVVAILASFLQLFGYGFGFLNGLINILILKKNERKVFRTFFFNKSK